MFVLLAAVGNPDLGQGARLPGVPTGQLKEVATLEEASIACREYIRQHNLGAGNWSGGVVLDKMPRMPQGANVVARISYNGRAWPVETKKEGGAQ